MTTDTNKALGLLTKEDIAGLRMANHAICLYHNKGTAWGRGTGCIRSLYQDTRHGVTIEGEYKLDVPSYIHTYLAHLETVDLADLNGWSYNIASQFDGNWGNVQSIIWILRPGDRVSLDWGRDAGNDYVKDVDMHTDMVWIVVKRGKHTLRFLADVSTCPANTARMTRNASERGGWG